MDIEPTITTLHVNLSEKTRDEIRKRITKLERFYPRLGACRVVVEGPPGHHRSGGQFQVRLDLSVPGTELVVNHQAADDLRVAIREAFDAARRQLQDFARKQRGEVKTHESPPRGEVIRLFSEEGYGFVATVDGREIYFHRNSVLDSAFDKLEVGSPVHFLEEAGDKGPQASTVMPLG